MSKIIVAGSDDWHALAWILTRRHPERYSERHQPAVMMGETNPLFRSKHYSEFYADQIGDPIVNSAALAACLADPPPHKPGERCAFIDFCYGGEAENVCAARDGNRVDILFAFRESNTRQAVYHIIEELKRAKLHNSQVWGDDGGGGRLMIDQMEELGWPIGRLRNEMTGLEPEAFSNAGSEIWYRAAELIAKKEVILPHDRIFFEQAINRGREHTPQSKLRAESKDDLRRRGVVSPDRADAVFSCLFVSALKPSFREVGIKFGNAFF